MSQSSNGRKCPQASASVHKSRGKRRSVSRASRWFRLYSEVRNDPKILRLSVDDRWKWIVALCVAAEHDDGILPTVSDMALHWRCTEHEAERAYIHLVNVGLLRQVQGDVTGQRGYAPHNWAKRQYFGADSTERSKRHRAKKERRLCNANATDVRRESDVKPDSDSASVSEVEIQGYVDSCQEGYGSRSRDLDSTYEGSTTTAISTRRRGGGQ